MLQFFHKYQKSVVVYLLVGVILFSMVFFGLDQFGQTSGQQYALKINDSEITYSEVADRRRGFEAQLRQQFGDAFDSLWEFLSRDMNQRIVDSFVEEKLMDQLSAQQGLGAATAEVAQTLHTLFQGQLSASTYQNYLQQRRLTATEFEAELAQQIKREQITNVLSDFSAASDYEALRIGQREEAKIDVQFVKFVPEKLKGSVKQPTDQELLEYYEQSLNRYELAPRVNYRALLVAPENVVNSVDVIDEDVELYYTEHESEFKKPASARVAHIQINFTSDSSPAAMNAVRQKAEDIREQALRGADFNALVVKHSDDLTTKILNGSLGWIEEGSRDDGVAKVALALKQPGIADLVSTDYGFHIVKVLEYQASGTKALKDVADQIREKLKQLEAPAFALAKAEDLLGRLKSEKLSIAELAKSEGYKLIDAKKLVDAKTDLDPAHAGLTAAILEAGDEKLKLVELGNQNFVVETIDYQPTTLPEFDAVKEKVREDWLTEKADNLASQKADEFVKKFDAQQPYTSQAFSNNAKAQGLTVEELKEITSAKADQPIFSEADLKRIAFRQSTPGIVGARSFKITGEYIVAAVSNIVRPESDKLTNPLGSYRDRVSQNNQQAVKTSLLKSLQAKAEIDIRPEVLVN